MPHLLTPGRVLAVALSLSCVFLLGREIARRDRLSGDPGPAYATEVAAAERAALALARAPAEAPTFVDVAERLRPSVVSIHGGSRSEGQSGTGVVVSSDGLILTNNHVIDGLESIRVTLSSSEFYVATVVGTDEPTDLAVIKVSGVSGLLPAVWGDSDGLRVAEDVLAIGNAFGLNWTVTRGIVSSLHREVVTDPRLIRRSSIEPYTDYIQTDAAINPGNSGGPIVNARGEVVGISTAILSKTSDGIGFAIPSNDARFVANELIARGYVRRGYLGVQGTDLTAYPNEERRRIAPNSIARLIVSRVEPDTPAERAGLMRDDVVLALNGRVIESFQGLRNIIARTPPGTAVTLLIVREGEEREISAVVGDFPGG